MADYVWIMGLFFKVRPQWADTDVSNSFSEFVFWFPHIAMHCNALALSIDLAMNMNKILFLVLLLVSNNKLRRMTRFEVYQSPDFPFFGVGCTPVFLYNLERTASHWSSMERMFWERSSFPPPQRTLQELTF